MREITYSKYQKVNCCTECDWIHNPEDTLIVETICPECGSRIKAMVGRYVYSKLVAGMYGGRMDVMGFEKKPVKVRNGWIKVSDKMPSKNKYYLVSDGDNVWEDFYREDGEWDDVEYQENITHWQPMVSPP